MSTLNNRDTAGHISTNSDTEENMFAQRTGTVNNVHIHATGTIFALGRRLAVCSSGHTTSHVQTPHQVRLASAARTAYASEPQRDTCAVRVPYIQVDCMHISHAHPSSAPQHSPPHGGPPARLNWLSGHVSSHRRGGNHCGAAFCASRLERECCEPR